MANTLQLNPRAALPVIREHDIDLDPDDLDAQRNVPKVETGVEKAEEIVGFPSSLFLVVLTFRLRLFSLADPPGDPSQKNMF